LKEEKEEVFKFRFLIGFNPLAGILVF